MTLLIMNTEMTSIPGDPESVSVQAAALAIEKPGGDTLSDSGKGRSSYIASTAGMTTFSEVSWILWKRLWSMNIIDFFQGIFERELGDIMGTRHGITLKNPDAGNKLHIASQKGELQEVKRLTEEEKLDPLGLDKSGFNSLHLAAMGDHLDVLRYFIEDRGCSAACVDRRGVTPLHVAAQLKHLDIVQYLIEKQQVEPFSRTSDGFTALHCACAGGSIDIIHYLAKEMSKYLPLKEVAEDQVRGGFSPLHLAAMRGHLEAVKFMINELNSDPNATNDGGNALHCAVIGGHLEVVRYLIEYHQQHCDPLCRSTKDPRSRGWHNRAFLLGLASRKGHPNQIKGN